MPITRTHGAAYTRSVSVDYEAAKPLLQTSKVNANRIGRDSTLLGRCDGNLGLIALLQEDYPLAKSYLDPSLVLQQGAGNKNGMAEALWLQGRLALRQGNHAEALGHFQESLKLYRIYSNSLWVTRGLAYLAITFFACGELPSAATLAGNLGEQEGNASVIRLDLGSRVAISEYEAAIAQLRRRRTSKFGPQAVVRATLCRAQVPTILRRLSLETTER